jgi:hypothetical protein
MIINEAVDATLPQEREELYFDCMATPATERIKALEDSMTKVQAVLGLPKKTWGQRLRQNVFLVLAGLGLVIAFFAWLQPQWKQHESEDLTNQIDRQVDKKLEKPQATISDIGRDVAEMKGKVNALWGLMQLRSSATMPENKFKENLAQVEEALEILKVQQQQTSVGEDVVAKIRQRILGTNPMASNYWGAAAALISFTSHSLPPNMPPCEIHAYGGEYSSSLEPEKKLPGEIKYITEIGCTAYLDGQSVARTRFQNVKVVYRGGSVTFGPNVNFIDCEYDIQLVNEPPPDGRRFTNTLLAAASVQAVHMN